MGYDMDAIGDPTPEETALHEQAKWLLEQARTAREAAGEKRHFAYRDDDPAPTPLQSAEEEAWERYYATDTSSYRLNVWGMGKARDLMDRMGMLLWIDESASDSPLPPWPTDEAVAAERARQGITEEQDYDRDVSVWEQLAQPRLSWTQGDTPGLMGHKLCSNDPWVITPGECRAVVLRWAQLKGSPELEELLAAGSNPRQVEHHGDMTELPMWWDGWMDWHARCGARGGYTQG